MEFWGIEVKPGQTVKCDPGQDRYIHLSHASIGESKKANASVPLYVHFEGKKLVVGTLSTDKFPQISYDLVFEKEFELSHGGKDGSVFITGYKTLIADNEMDGFSDSESEDEDDVVPIPIEEAANGKQTAKKVEAVAKVKALPAKAKAKTEEPAKAVADKKKSDSGDDEESEEDTSDDDEEGESSDEMMVDSDDDSDEEESSEEDSDEDEEKVTPKKAEVSKKRPVGSDSKTPVGKKAKVVTPAGKADGKKGGHVATPYPNKHAAKTPANDSKAKSQTPKSGGSVTCKSCTKTFNSEKAMESHSKAKHASGK